MTEPPEIVLQYVIVQRDQRPSGRRVLADGKLQHVATENPLPTPTERLDLDRVLTWQDERVLAAESIQAIRQAVLDSGFFDLEPRLLINYCKEDPPAAIWTVNVEGRQARVVVFDPRPKRSAAIDKLNETLKAILG